MKIGMRAVVFLWILLVCLLMLTFYPWLALLRGSDAEALWFVAYLKERNLYTLSTLCSYFVVMSLLSLGCYWLLRRAERGANGHVSTSDKSN